jgi:hypothetical protein
MFLKCSTRKKDGKAHRSWSIVESRRVGRSVVQRHVLYLGEINDCQRAAWQKSIAVFDEAHGQARQCALFPEDRTAAAHRSPKGRGAGINVVATFAPARVKTPMKSLPLINLSLQ